jgi:signal transduction histidine kinase
MLADMYDELRGVCFNLMPTTLIRLGLIDAISEFVGRVNMAGKIEIEVTNYGFENRLEELSEISLYRVVQEWVNNILKYSNANTVVIQFTKEEDELTLTLEDDGIGFDTSKLGQSNGNGWKNINSRVKLLGGTVDVDSTIGHEGTILIINIPLS